jgi:hypothetical protein
MMNHGRMQRSMIDWHTSKSVGENKLIWKQEMAKKLAHAKFQQNERITFTL